VRNALAALLLDDHAESASHADRAHAGDYEQRPRQIANPRRIEVDAPEPAQDFALVAGAFDRRTSRTI
jgi:hypothetical protein